jgi:hypothetical protein
MDFGTEAFLSANFHMCSDCRFGLLGECELGNDQEALSCNDHESCFEL